MTIVDYLEDTLHIHDKDHDILVPHYTHREEKEGRNGCRVVVAESEQALLEEIASVLLNM